MSILVEITSDVLIAEIGACCLRGWELYISKLYQDNF